MTTPNIKELVLTDGPIPQALSIWGADPGDEVARILVIPSFNIMKDADDAPSTSDQRSADRTPLDFTKFHIACCLSGAPVLRGGKSMIEQIMMRGVTLGLGLVLRNVSIYDVCATCVDLNELAVCPPIVLNVITSDNDLWHTDLSLHIANAGMLALRSYRKNDPIKDFLKHFEDLLEDRPGSSFSGTWRCDTGPIKLPLDILMMPKSRKRINVISSHVAITQSNPMPWATEALNVIPTDTREKNSSNEYRLILLATLPESERELMPERFLQAIVSYSVASVRQRRVVETLGPNQFDNIVAISRCLQYFLTFVKSVVGGPRKINRDDGGGRKTWQIFPLLIHLLVRMGILNAIVVLRSL